MGKVSIIQNEFVLEIQHNLGNSYVKIFLSNYYESYRYNDVILHKKTNISVLYLTIYEGSGRIGIPKPLTNALCSLSCAIRPGKRELILNTL